MQIKKITVKRKKIVVTKKKQYKNQLIFRKSTSIFYYTKIYFIH